MSATGVAGALQGGECALILPAGWNETGPGPWVRGLSVGLPEDACPARYSREERNIRTMRNMFTKEMKKFSAPQLVITARLRASPLKL